MQSKSKIKLSISDMDCASCVARLEDGLSKLDGVENAEVNFGTEKASVDFDPGKTNIQELREQVSKLGYRVIGEEGEEEKALSEVSKVMLSLRV